MEVPFLASEIKSMSTLDIQYLIAEYNKVLEERKQSRRGDLIKTICDAMNELYKEFPSTELNIERRCSDCGYDEDFDILYELCSGRTMKPSDFSVW
jgi:hypothetical protein